MYNNNMKGFATHVIKATSKTNLKKFQMFFKSPGNQEMSCCHVCLFSFCELMLTPNEHLYKYSCGKMIPMRTTNEDQSWRKHYTYIHTCEACEIGLNPLNKTK